MGRLIDALTELQHKRGCLDKAALRQLADELGVPQFRLQELVSFYPHFRSTPPKRVTLAVCRDVACQMAKTTATAGALTHAGDMADVQIEQVSCLGRCDMAPAATIHHHKDTPAHGETPVALCNAETLRAQLSDAPILPECKKRSFRCDPYGEGQAHYGVTRRLVKAGFDGDAVTQTLSNSGLRGMGGAGFPTGRKWAMVRGQPSAGGKYVICNADESEPGTFKDRETLAQLPYLVVEGMLLAGLTVEAEQGIVFIRHEYGPERLALERAIQQARDQGVIGDNACGSGRCFDISVAVSPGGYILGEETALLECLEDKRGEPRNKPPYPGEKGLFGQPTLINNVETFAFVPTIVDRGAAAWKGHGLGEMGGLKLIALSGDVRKPGVYEVAMGTTLGALIEMGGGVIDDRPIAAIAPGGASSNFVAGSRLDLQLDFDAMTAAGTMLGSGAVLVIAEGRDLLDIATNLVSFFRNESCGKCVPCRIGSEKAVQLLNDGLAGRGSKVQLALLPALAETMKQTSICGLGQVALMPFVSALALQPDIADRFSSES